MKKLSRPAKMWLIAATLIVFDFVIVYLFINQPVDAVLGQEAWDFRHADLRELEDHAIQQSSQSAEEIRPQSPADQNGQVL